MQLDHLAHAAVNQVIGGLVRRLVIAAIFALCAIVAVYHFTIAGTLALEAQVGVLEARLIIAGVYTFAALVAAAVLWRQARLNRLPGSQDKALTSPREMQLIMLVEAVMLGYELARKGVRSR